MIYKFNNETKRNIYIKVDKMKKKQRLKLFLF